MTRRRTWYFIVIGVALAEIVGVYFGAAPRAAFWTWFDAVYWTGVALAAHWGNESKPAGSNA